MTVICWFKKDLRVQDHAALAQAAKLGPVLPVYVLEPALWQQPDMSGRQFAFLRESLRDLHRQLAERGLTLCLRVGDAAQELEALRQEISAQHLVSHEETGNAWTFARDRLVGDWARAQGVEWIELTQSGVVRRMNGRNGWATLRNAYLRQPTVTLPAVQGLIVPSHPWPDLLPDDCPQRQKGGRQEGLSLLGGFLAERGRTYRSAMSSPLEGAQACSRLSPHLVFGTLSGREAAQATAARQREVTGGRTGWAGSLKSFQARLAWRDHFMQKLEDEPPLEWKCLHPAYEGLRDDDATRRQAWAEGQTGLPFVDACMRSLAATGWLNFRMRSMVMAVASYHLWLDWRATGQHLARMFTDYEPGIHWPQVQMQSGTTGMNTIRIYNPVKQGHDQDASGTFTRLWVPELHSVPDEFLQEPWMWEGHSRLRYPAPMVDPQIAARHAREVIWAVRKEQGCRETAYRLVDRHASRKRPPRPAKTGRRFVDQRQMGFDF